MILKLIENDKITKGSKKKNNKNKENKPRFRIRSKTFFLTYPQAPTWATESMFLDCYWKMFPKQEHETMKYLITREMHEDGNPHFHVFLEFPFTNDLSREKLHVNLKDSISGEEVVLEGKYETAKKKYSVMKYMLKSKNPEQEPFTNIHLLIYKNEIHDNVESYLYHKAQYEGVEKVLLEILDRFPEFRSQFTRLKSTFKAIRTVQLNKERQEALRLSILPLTDFKNVPPAVWAWAKEHPTTKTLAIYGPPNVGKTELSLSLMKSKVNKPLLIRDENQLRDIELTEEHGLVIDDYDMSKLSREGTIHLIDNKREGSVRMLYDQINIPANTPRIFVANNIPSYMKNDRALEKRLLFVEISKPVYVTININVEKGGVINLVKPKLEPDS